MNDYMGGIYARQNILMRFRNELVMGLYETVEIQSMTRESHIVVCDREAFVMDNDTSFVKQNWAISYLIDRLE